MLFHTHGQNWATSRPLGNGRHKNKHINTLWMPRSIEDPFPLVQLDRSEYENGEVANIPLHLIHGISKKREKTEEIPSLSAILSDNELKTDLVAKTRFGELACLHIYYPHQPLVNELANSPLLKKDERFFLEYDMIVFDHYERTIWSGGGGSWPKRMIEFGPSGEHCGICFENDARRENLDPRLVSKWFVADPPKDLIKIKSR